MVDDIRLIHWRGTPAGVCDRKDSGVDVESSVQGQTTITRSAEADYLGNVTCPVCKRYEREDWRGVNRVS